MSQHKLHIVIQQGADFPVTHQWKTPEDVPVDLTGCNVVMQVKASYTSPTPLLEASTYNGYITLDAPNGKIIIDIPASETRDLTFSKGVHDLIVIWPDGDVTRLLEGTVELSPGVTLSWQTA